jgi:uncharacterized protein
MKIVIPGGSGQVGTCLARSFHADGHDVVVLSRRAAATPWRTVAWELTGLGDWTREIDGADVVINLAGRSVNCRYTAKNRAEIIESRVASVQAVGRAVQEAKRPPAVWLQASTATIYAHNFGPPHDERSGAIGGSEPRAPETWNFSIDVVRRWEQALDALPPQPTRRVKLRAAVILSPDRGGIFDTLLGLVRRGLGGTSGDGRQYVSWIHEHDFVRAVRWLIEREHLDGAVNLASPGALPNREFMKVLREAWGMPIGLPASRWMLEIGALLMRTETELILKSRHVASGRLLEDGFRFQYPEWPEAARELCARWRAGT